MDIKHIMDVGDMNDVPFGDLPVDSIVDGAWWYSSTRETYYAHYVTMVCQFGLSSQSAVRVLHDLYWGAAEEFGA